MDEGRHLPVIVLVFVGLYFLPALAGAATFTASNSTAFQNALNNAQTNSQDDVIHVQADMNITSTLTYTGESRHTLTIEGHGHYLDGGNSTRIIKIDTTGLGSDSDSDITIRNLTFQHGSNSTGQGGALYAKTTDAALTVDGCAFIKNIARHGGGAYVLSSNSGNQTFINNIFNQNSVDYYGGGAYVNSYSGRVTLINNTFSQNSTNNSGGGAYVRSNSGTATLTNNTFVENSAHDEGGGAFINSNSGRVTLTNNTFSSNSASSSYGGGAYMYSNSGTATLTNNTFSGNSAASYGGGASVSAHDDSTTLNIYNNIIWDNNAGHGGNDGDDLYVNPDGDGNNASCTVNLYNNDLGPNSDFTTGQSEDLSITFTDNHYHHAGNISTDPLLADPAIGNFHLQSGSPCIDAGLNTAPGIPSTDFEGDNRIINGTVDIGVDETQPVKLTVTKSGSGTGTVTATGCSLAWAGNTGTCTTSAGKAITLSGSASTGSAFAGWSAGTGSAASCSGTGDCTFNLATNSTVTATFTLNQHTITESASPVAGGSVSCNPNPVAHGSNSTCTITANQGYTLQNVTGTCGGTLSGNTYTTSTITADCTVQANFNLNQNVTVASATRNGDITIQTNSANCGLYNVTVRSESDVGNDPDYDYPYGLVEFSLNCPQADVTITFPGDVSNMTYRKYGPTTPGNPSTTQWYTFQNVIVSGNQVTLHLQDGQLGDDTGVDGFIFDQGGPGQRGRVTVPTMNEWGTIVFMVLTGLVALFYLRRRRMR